MRVLVDADACPVKKIIEKVCKEFNIEVIMYIDSSHELYSDYSQVVIVDKGIDSVDLKILKEIVTGDIVVTQDYGLASLVLSKGGKCLNQNGLIYTENNIERLLFERYIGSENRKKGIRTKNMSKRKISSDILFEEVFTSLVKEAL